MTDRAHAGANERFDDPRLERMQERIRELSEALNRNPFLRGRLITEEDGLNVVAGSGLAFVSGTARSIPHRLGRKARGFVEVYGAEVASAGHVGLRATAFTSTGVTPDTHIRVTPAATGTCFIWVF